MNTGKTNVAAILMMMTEGRSGSKVKLIVHKLSLCNVAKGHAETLNVNN